MIIPNLWENKTCSKPPTSDNMNMAVWKGNMMIKHPGFSYSIQDPVVYSQKQGQFHSPPYQELKWGSFGLVILTTNHLVLQTHTKDQYFMVHIWSCSRVFPIQTGWCRYKSSVFSNGGTVFQTELSWNGGSKSSMFQKDFHYEPSILGYPHLWTPPYGSYSNGHVYVPNPLLNASRSPVAPRLAS